MLIRESCEREIDLSGRLFHDHTQQDFMAAKMVWQLQPMTNDQCQQINDLWTIDQSVLFRQSSLVSLIP